MGQSRKQNKTKTSTKTDKHPNIFLFSDYRLYLKDYFNYHKDRTAGFSHRSFAIRAGLRYHTHTQKVIGGKIKLSEDLAKKYMKGLRLNQKQSDYFRFLVSIEDPLSVKFTEGNKSKYLFFNESFILQMTRLKNFRPDPHWISKTLKGIITYKEAADALRYLLKSGLIINEKGKWIRKYKVHLHRSEPKKQIRSKELQKSIKAALPEFARNLLKHSKQTNFLMSSMAVDPKVAQEVYNELQTVLIRSDAEVHESKKKEDHLYSIFVCSCHLAESTEDSLL